MLSKHIHSQMTEDMKKKKNTNNIRKYLPWDIFLQSHILRYKHAAGEFLELVSDNRIPGHGKSDSLGVNKIPGHDGGDFLGLNTGVVLFNLTRWDDLAMTSYAHEISCFLLIARLQNARECGLQKAAERWRNARPRPPLQVHLIMHDWFYWSRICNTKNI